MQNNNKLRAALLAAVVLCGSGVSCVRADNVFGTAENGWHTVIDSDYDGNVYGNNGNPDADNVVTGHVEMTDGSVKNIYGGYSESGPVSGSTATVSGGTVGALVYGGHSGIGSVSWNKAILTGYGEGDSRRC